MDDGQTQAGMLGAAGVNGLGSEEGFADMPQVVFGHADTGIADPQEQLPVIRRQPKLDLQRAAGGHGFAGVGRQAAQNGRQAF
jgi:hypothetical protein